MSLLCKKLVIALAVLLSSTAFAKELSVDELRAIQSKMKSSDKLTASFVQTRYAALRGKSTTRKGQASFAKPNLFRWTMEQPSKQLIFDGKSFFDYDPEAKAAVKYSPKGPSARELTQIVDLVLNFDSLLNRYDLIKALEDGDQVTVLLRPKKKSDLEQIELRYAKAADYLTYIRLDLANKNRLTHEFSKPSKGTVPEGAFAVPPGVSITNTDD